MARGLTVGEIVKMWWKTTFIAILLAISVQITTLLIGNGNENIPSEEQCQELYQQNSIIKFQSFMDFYPFYLCEHTLGMTKLFHFCATVNAISIIVTLITRKWQWKLLFFSFLQTYGLAWVSHFFIERNVPATFTYPAYSFCADFKMFFDIMTLKFPPFL